MTNSSRLTMIEFPSPHRRPAGVAANAPRKPPTPAEVRTTPYSRGESPRPRRRNRPRTVMAMLLARNQTWVETASGASV
jgi:hypothetical protein